MADAVAVEEGATGDVEVEDAGVFHEERPLEACEAAGLLRNVAVALGNWGSPDAVPVLAKALNDEDPLIRWHAARALGRIGTTEGVKVLRGREAVEEDAWVREELLLAPSS